MKNSPMMICANGIEYEPLKYTDKKVEENYDVYTITAEPLPSNMRSLLPASEKHMDTYVTMMTNKNRLKYVILTLSLFTVSVILLAVSVIVGFKQTTSDASILQRLTAKPKHNSTITDIKIQQSLKDGGYKNEVYPAYVTRTPCINECWAYAAFRFKAVCDQGFCHCKGPNYDPLTCLPHVEDCNMMVNTPSVAVAKINGKQQKLFACKSAQVRQSKIHVLSIFGNHRAASTMVNISGSSSQPKVLVLVNYHPITWDIRVSDPVELEQIVMVSFNHLSKTRVLLPDNGSMTKPIIRRLFSLTGYGQDRFGGHTPELLKNIVGQFGAIATFTGASHADNWDVNFNNLNGSDPTST
ncbi:uncharacterized protein LOC126827566 [Patella vulgata]|uniref:uncharacterized protein LOC126827566 n=1 Tax=Patella vulgata TaxID=6465 RepID=UPI002180640C|nr:uncharacterized protein LOC126827566 [Patella vulgata]